MGKRELLFLFCFLFITESCFAFTFLGRKLVEEPSYNQVIESVYGGKPFQAIRLQAIRAFFSGFGEYEASLLKKLVNVIRDRKVLVVQRYEFTPQKSNFSPFLMKVFMPIDNFPNQQILWRNISVSAPYEMNSDSIRIHIENNDTVKVRVASCVETIFNPASDLPDLELPPNQVSESFTKPISREINNLKDIQDHLQHLFGQYREHNGYVSLPLILLNPFQALKCVEFSRIVLGILNDKGLPANYRIGIQFDYTKQATLNYPVFHSWVGFKWNDREFEIDPTAGKTLGLTSYLGSNPRCILFRKGWMDPSYEIVYNPFKACFYWDPGIKSKQLISCFDIPTPVTEFLDGAEFVLSGKVTKLPKVEPYRKHSVNQSEPERNNFLPVGGIIGDAIGFALNWN